MITYRHVCAIQFKTVNIIIPNVSRFSAVGGRRSQNCRTFGQGDYNKIVCHIDMGVLRITAMFHHYISASPLPQKITTNELYFNNIFIFGFANQYPARFSFTKETICLRFRTTIFHAKDMRLQPHTNKRLPKQIW